MGFHTHCAFGWRKKELTAAAVDILTIPALSAQVARILVLETNNYNCINAIELMNQN